ncbi:MAG: hypothetical protein H7144_11985, partial [Burkholderiales bacterium]|nr:hypothetical protein [Phycisphaerae bacterium]
MKAKPFKQATTTAFPEAQTDEVIAEALAKHAALRPPRAPAKAMPVTPTL